ncbi:MAG: hypothetical protein ACJ71W_01785 [Terriglobales bacterium]
MTSLIQDIRYAFRTMLRAPGELFALLGSTGFLEIFREQSSSTCGGADKGSEVTVTIAA